MTDLERPEAPTGTPGAPGRRGRRRRRAALVAVVLVALGAVLWWNRSVDAYDEAAYELTSALPEAGSSLLVGVGGRPRQGSVTLVDVVPVVTTNTAAAELEVVVCDEPDRGLPPGVVEATAVTYCGRAAAVEGYVQSAIEGGPEGPTARDRDGQLVLQVTPRQPGTVEVTGVQVTYRDGSRRQTQFLPSSVRLSSP